MVRNANDSATPLQIRLKRLLIHVPHIYKSYDRGCRQRYVTYLHILSDIINSLDKEKGNLLDQS